MKTSGKFLVLFSISLLLTGCSSLLTQKEDPYTTNHNTGFVKEQPGSYDSADTAVLVKRNKEEETITLFNIVTGKNYTLTYDGTTVISDKYGGAMSLAQLNAGDIVDVTFLKNKKKLRSISVSKPAWQNEAAGNFEIDQNKNSIQIGQEQYKLADNIMVVSDGRQAELMDINSCDTLLVKGIDRTIYSMTIESGHGYLRLQNAEYFVGGWIEIGNSIIVPVTEDMLLTVPEGKYDVLITHKGYGGSKPLEIIKNQESLLDVGDLKGEEILLGKVLFSATPSDAALYIDGDRVDASAPVELEYGTHQLIAKADGYETVTRYFRVGQAYANLDVEMDVKEEREENNSVSANSVSANSVSENSVSSNQTPPQGAQIEQAGELGNYKVSITSPEGAEVYFDGNYMGLAPVSFKKEAGNHVVTLRKSGSQTRSFTIQIDSEKKDISWAFSELEKITK